MKSAYSSEVTHLVHASKKSNESFKEFKSARSDKAFIVHPAWIEQVRDAFVVWFDSGLD